MNKLIVTERQKEVLSSFGIKVDDSLSHEEAAMLINQAYTQRRKEEKKQEIIKSRKYKDNLIKALTGEEDSLIKTSSIHSYFPTHSK